MSYWENGVSQVIFCSCRIVTHSHPHLLTVLLPILIPKAFSLAVEQDLGSVVGYGTALESKYNSSENIVLKRFSTGCPIS